MAATVFLAVLGALPGCGTPEGPPPDARTTAATRPTGDRPLSEVDPCRLLTEGQRRELGVDQPPRPDHDATLDAPGCVFAAEAAELQVDVVAVGAVVPTDLHARQRPDRRTREITVAGVPAREARPTTDGSPSGAGSCEVSVRVAEGQFLRVAVGQRSGPARSQDALCAKGVLVSEAVLTTLRERR
ncbi:DUF3558 domain-containing protein [Streptoalloteichus hindustanus]|nr:DUF3558 domain-containing protein [Streptoalloteichus hindustanus]